MLRFLTTYLLTLLAVFATAMMLPRMAWYGEVQPNWNGAWLIGITTVAVPFLTTWVVLEIIQRARPRRLLVGRRRGTLLLVSIGLTAAMLTSGLTGIGIGLLEGDVPDWGIVAISACIAAGMVLLPLPRYRRGRCIYCRYDLSGVTVSTAHRCPECGATSVFS